MKSRDELKVYFKKNLYSTTFLILGLLYIVLGIFVFRNTQGLLYIIPIISGGIFILSGSLSLISFIVTKVGRGKKRLSRDIIDIIIGILILYRPRIFLGLLPIFFALYSLILCIISAITYIQFRNNGIKKKNLVLLKAIIYLLFTIFLLSDLNGNTIFVMRTIGVFLVLYGITFFEDFLQEEKPREYTDNLKRRIRITLPVFFIALVPNKAVKKINEYLSSDVKRANELEYVDPDKKIDLEIFVHVRKSGMGAFGHVDIFFDGRFISYGNYDYDSLKLYESIGDGVIFTTTKREEYIRLCNEVYDKTLFAFGLSLNESQLEKVRKRIDEIFENTYSWEPPILTRPEETPNKNDYASILYKWTGAKYRKFKSGEFKSYFVLSTNCVLLADSIVGKAGIDILNINGLVSPGAYYTYLDKEFRRQNSIVLSKKAYTPNPKK